jgi:S1-C subfamily serine protease
MPPVYNQPSQCAKVLSMFRSLASVRAVLALPKMKFLVAGGLLGAAIGVACAYWLLGRAPGPSALSQEQIDAAVLRTLETQPLPSRAALAAEKVRQAVVKVQGYQDAQENAPRKAPPKADSEESAGLDTQASIGSGVLISEEGLILTNLHVVAGSKRLTVQFFDGSETPAEVVGLRQENDLAVIKVKKLPDDITPATLGGSQGVVPGDEVVAVGFPFGIGPSVSAGVVSGMNREFKSSRTGHQLSGLIQFDAAANPGNSGGPLINMSGEVIGIVTAIFTPNRSRTFIGIGFAVTMEAAGGGAGIPPL